MQNQLIGWLGATIFVLAILATVAADFIRQHAAAAPAAGENPAPRQVGGWVFWLTVAAVVLGVAAAVATVVRLAALS